jgi:hypothetical protein
VVISVSVIDAALGDFQAQLKLPTLVGSCLLHMLI